MNLFEVMTGPVSRMAHVNRYSSFPVNRPENVAEHSWMVAFITMLVAGDLAHNDPEAEINPTQAVMRALLHDLDECISGDIIRNFKYSSEQLHQEIVVAGEKNMYQLSREIGGHIGDEIFCVWRDAKVDGLEGDIVRFADMAAASFYMREEDRTGNRTIRPVLKEMYETWFHEFHEHPELGQYLEQMYPNGRFFDMFRETDLPAAKMFEAPQWHDEGPTAQHDFTGDGKEVPLS